MLNSDHDIFGSRNKTAPKAGDKAYNKFITGLNGGDIDPLILTKASPGDLPTKVLDVRDTMQKKKKNTTEL